MHHTGEKHFSRWGFLISQIVFLLENADVYLHLSDRLFPWACPRALWNDTHSRFANLQASLWSTLLVVSLCCAVGPWSHPSPFGHRSVVPDAFPQQPQFLPLQLVMCRGQDKELMEDVPWMCCSHRQVIFQAYWVFCALVKIYRSLMHIICQCLTKHWEQDSPDKFFTLISSVKI